MNWSFSLWKIKEKSYVQWQASFYKNEINSKLKVEKVIAFLYH